MTLSPTLALALRRTTVEATRNGANYDAIVVGAGAAGSFAACLLTEAGLRVLVLDAGLPPSPIQTLSRRLVRGVARRAPGNAALAIVDRRQAIQSQCYAYGLAPHAFVDDVDCPYVTPSDRPFIWLRARQLGGRWVIPGHGLQYYRLGPTDFAPIDGLSQPWPLRPNELDPWYAAVERRVHLAGMRDHLPWLPDGELSTELALTPPEAALQASITARWPGARPIVGRFAPPPKVLEDAARTGRLLIRTGAIARGIDVDDSGRARGVIWIDRTTGAEERASAPVVFLCASALESTRLLLLSRSKKSPDGLGASSGALGRYLMDHIPMRVEGYGPPLLPAPTMEDGRCIYLPRFDARDLPSPSPGRGFGVQVRQTPLKEGKSKFMAVCFSEMLPRPENRVTLDPKRCDAWGIPILHIDCRHNDAELERARDQFSALKELAEVAGVTVTQIGKAPGPPGISNHECGTARMGSDPENSVLDPNNECWDARGLYVTDGASFPSQGTQNPTLTILALTARACDHAIRTAHHPAI